MFEISNLLVQAGLRGPYRDWNLLTRKLAILLKQNSLLSTRITFRENPIFREVSWKHFARFENIDFVLNLNRLSIFFFDDSKVSMNFILNEFLVWYTWRIVCVNLEQKSLTHSVAVLEIMQRGGTSLGRLFIFCLLELSKLIDDY